MRDVIRRLRGDDRGAVGVLVAILLGGGVLLGMAALVVDVGQIYAERAELQNGADAGALAVARTCAVTACDTGLAAGYADANASDGAALVADVCGSGPGLGGCPASSGALTDCPPAPPAEYVDVHTATETGDGATLLPPTFAQALAGNADTDGTAVKACARAAWGPPATATTIALTISACEWDAATASGASFAPPPPATPSPADDRVLRMHSTETNVGCPTRPAGADGPGAFGWTDDPDVSCSVDIDGGTYGGKTGVASSGACKTAIHQAWSSRQTVYVPVYTSVSGTGTNVTYTLEGFAAFVITGYRFPGFTGPDWLNPANDCTGPDFCINGYFTQGLIPSAGTIGGPDLGVTIVKLTG